MAIILPFFEEWAAAGLLMDKPARILAETTPVVLSLIHFRNEIEDDGFSKVMNIFIDLLAENISKNLWGYPVNNFISGRSHQMVLSGKSSHPKKCTIGNIRKTHKKGN